MTIQEAKDYVIYMFCGDCPYAFDSDCSNKKCKQAMDMVYNALNKQVPVKSTPDEHCPACGWFLVTRGGNKMRFCPHCGQAIDWSE